MITNATALLSHDGELYVAGGIRVNGETCTVARWNGAAWEKLGPSIPWVQDLQPFGKGLLATTAQGLFSWDGRTWTSWGETPMEIRLLAVHDEALYAIGWPRGGSYYSPQFLRREGSAWRSLSGFDSGVNVLASYAGSLYAGGQFRLSGDVPSACIARWEGPRLEAAESEAPGPGRPNSTAAVQRTGLGCVRLGSAVHTGTELEVHIDVATGGVPVQLLLFDVRGRLVRSLLQGAPAPGLHVLRWNWRDATGLPAPSGVYFLQLRSAETTVETRKLPMVR
jgi:hypothetical protein